MNYEISSLCKAYMDFFPIGAAVNSSQIISDKELIINNFNSITPENELKFINTQPEEGVYSFDNADKIIDFAIENNMKVRGHTLICDNQTPDWVFKDKNGMAAERELVLERMKLYIQNIIEKYRNKVYCWDVVNEAIDDNDEILLRETRWKSCIGNDYIDKAFIFAHEADPNALLFYNDYNGEVDAKREKIYNLVKGMISRGVPIHGIGLQGHYDLHFPQLSDIRRTIEKIAELGIKIQITEMDISVFKFDDHSRNLTKPTPEMIKKQTELYEGIFAIFREYRDVISGVTLWGVTDAYTWRDDFPIKGRKDWPLLFNKDFSPKPALNSITHFYK